MGSADDHPADKAPNMAPSLAESSSPAPPSLQPGEHWVNALGEDLAQGEEESMLSNDSDDSQALPPEWRDKLRMINGRWYAQANAGAGGQAGEGSGGDPAKVSQPYWGPVEETHLEHLDLVHQSLLIQLDERLFLAPLSQERTRRVLDVATGSGVWVLDFAEQFPNAEVIGTDLVLPDLPHEPDNVQLVRDDFTTDRWGFPDNSFDFVHMRHLMGSVPDWEALYRKAFAVCAPGGWVETVETDEELYSDDGSVRPGMALHEWGIFWRRGARAMGRIWAPVRGNRQQRFLEAAGFVDVHVHDLRTPIGPWPRSARGRELGVLAAMALTVDQEGLITFMINMSGENLGPEHIAAYCRQFDRELRSRRYRPYLFSRVVWARKPEEHELPPKKQPPQQQTPQPPAQQKPHTP